MFLTGKKKNRCYHFHQEHVHYLLTHSEISQHRLGLGTRLQLYVGWCTQEYTCQTVIPVDLYNDSFRVFEQHQ